MPRPILSPLFLAAMLTASVMLGAATLVPSRPGPEAETRPIAQARGPNPWRLYPDDVETTGSITPSAPMRQRPPAIAEERRPVRVIAYPGPVDPR